MSSSGGGFTPPTQPATDCTTLVIRTQLASPVPAVIATLKIGDLLSVTPETPRGPVRLITESGEIAGAILPIDIAALLQCISDGHEYNAKVTELKGGNCQVLIKHT
jgi:hypothetical protein